MVAYSFKPRFVDPIISGRKQQTVRAIGRRRHARAAEQVQLYTGMRTRACRLIGRAICIEAIPVALRFGRERAVVLTGALSDTQRLAKARERVVWMHRQHMPTRGATKALAAAKAEFERLRLAPPAKAAELAPLKAAIAEMLTLIENCLRQRGPA